MNSHIDALREIVQSGTGEFTTLFLENSVRDVDIGIYEHEIGDPQRISFDIHVVIGGASKPEEDEIDMVLDYEYDGMYEDGEDQNHKEKKKVCTLHL